VDAPLDRERDWIEIQNGHYPVIFARALCLTAIRRRVRVIVWLRQEIRALARGLRAEGAAGRQSAADAMLFRIYRHHLFPGSEAMEAAMEKHEGLAEYTGVFVAMRATGEDISREARVVEAFEDSTQFARSFAYATGPAVGLLLDRYAAGWRGRAASTPLDSMLISAVRVQP
jgi:hypothetical protein